MSKITSAVVGTLALVALAACTESKLVVTDLNQPDQGRALQSATDVENLLTGQFRVIWNNTQGYVIGMEYQTGCMGMEISSGLGNAEAGKYCGLPRSAVDNSINNPSFNVHEDSYLNLNRAARSVAIALNQMYQPTFTFVPADAKEFARDVAFGYFEMGVALGDEALVFDSGAVIAPGDNLGGSPPPLVGADSIMTVALGYLDSALAYAAQTPAIGTNGWPTPSAWINGQGLSAAAFSRLVHSFKARLRAGLARTPAERAAEDWTAIIADAQAGVTSDFMLQIDGNASPAWGYDPGQMAVGTTWAAMWQYIVAMADTSGNYALYLSNLANNGNFLVVTPDKRFPTGDHRSKNGPADTIAGPTGPQNLSSGCVGAVCGRQPVATAPYPYVRNHLPVNDVPVAPEMTSQYDWYRYQYIFDAVFVGPLPMITVAEMNGLQAEGYFRAGNYAAALPLVNLTRTAAGLHAVTAANNTTLLPGTDGTAGGAGCVPKVPAPPSYNTPVCGTLWEAIKWEKRMEEAYTIWGGWWIDGRGWGDLPNGTVLEFPTPYQELQTRVLPLYSTTRSAGTKGTYGI